MVPPAYSRGLRLRTVTSPLVARMGGFGTTIFAEMTALAHQTGAVNLGQGFPDTDGPLGMLERAQRAIGEGINQYPPGPGLAPLRQAISAHREDNYGLLYNPDTEVLVTVGATEAIAASMLAFCETGDEVVVFQPYYDSYAATIALAGAGRRPVTLRPDGPGARFTFDPDELRAAITPRAKVILVNSPHNPTGTVFTRDEMQTIADLATERDLLVVTDEVSEHLTYDDAEHIAIAMLPGMRERTVSISSAGKTFSVTGWKIGWVCAPARLVRAVTTVKQFLPFTASGPFQLAVAYAPGTEMEWVESLRLSLQDRRDRLAEGLEKVGLDVHRPAGTYFIQADVRAIGIDDTVAWARSLPTDGGVVAIPTAVFYDDVEAGAPYVRFAFCKRDDVLDEAVARLTAYAEKRRAG